MLALYGHLFSSYTWKALIPLYALGEDFEFRAVYSGHAEHDAFVAAAHPLGKFPVLVDGTTTVIEASSIIEHLAATRPAAARFIPANPAAAVQERMLDRVFDLSVQAAMQRVVNTHLFRPQDPDPAELTGGREQLQRCYAWLERWLGEHPLPITVSLATCAAAPALFYADWIEPIPDSAPLLQRLRADLLALPEVARCVDDARQFRPLFPPGAPDRD
jgi:glutathione S-transferase